MPVLSPLIIPSFTITHVGIYHCVGDTITLALSGSYVYLLHIMFAFIAYSFVSQLPLKEMQNS